MRGLAGRWTALAFAVAAGFVVLGCSDPDAPGARGASAMHGVRGGAASPGEPAAPPPPAAASETPLHVQPTPAKALAAFANLYCNWTYKTLNARQEELAGIAVGSARLAERQAAAASQADGTIRSGRLRNSGRVLGIAPDRATPGAWVIATREQTSGDAQYEGLPAGYHVTIARVATVPGGYAVSEWLPQS